MPFSRFMEQALYHPEHGYYSSGRCVIGRAGDYFTNVSVGPLFGQLMAAQFAEMWSILRQPAEFSIVEQGAHDGRFAHDVLSAARDRHPELFAVLTYRIVELSAQLRARQKEALGLFGERVSWRASLPELEPFCGLHFSNELFDALPVELVVWKGSEWLERHVVMTGDDFAFADLPVCSPQLQEQLREIPEPRTAPYETEVNLTALRCVETIAQKLTAGFVMAVDYGFPRHELYAPHRTTGTLQCRARHRMVISPLLEIGEADITAHVDWTTVAERGESAGLSLLGFVDQHHFITGLLASGASHYSEDTADAKSRRALQTLLHPGFLGMRFQFLVMGKSIDSTSTLAGLQFARNSRDALGLSA